MFCSSCGAEISETDSLCPACGEVVRHSGAVSDMPQEKPARGCFFWGCLSVIVVSLLIVIGVPVAGFFWVRSEDIERTNKERSTHDVQGLSTSRYAKQYSMIYDKKYNVTDAAFVKAGCLTGNKLYDHCLGNRPLPYDCTIRLITMKIKYMNTIMRDKITYGT
mgnify:CR=1 FL=1